MTESEYQQRYAVDNASLGTAEDQHPCGGFGENGSHSYKTIDNVVVCEDCGYQPDEEW